MTATRLFSRAIVRVSPQDGSGGSGEDVAEFLQGLVTNDVKGVLPIWAGLLTPQDDPRPPVKLKSALRCLRACFLSHFSLSSIEYSQARLRSRSSPVSSASRFSPMASAILRLRSSLAKLRARSRCVLTSEIKS